jgi:hypothetical protein
MANVVTMPISMFSRYQVGPIVVATGSLTASARCY